MRFRRGEIREFFANSSSDNATLRERRKWLNESPEEFASVLPAGVSLLDEAVALAESLDIPVGRQESPMKTCVQLGRVWAPDILLLRPVEDSQPCLVAGCVCFPSSWSLAEKMGRPLDAIHEPVPTLNAQFSIPVKQFLSRMKPGISWERINWGLSRSSELNQHPHRRLPRLDASVELKDVWFRVEYQSLVMLPQTGGILFGIRLIIAPLEELCSDGSFASGLAGALRTMPDAIAGYKGIRAGRERLIELLRAG